MSPLFSTKLPFLAPLLGFDMEPLSKDDYRDAHIQLLPRGLAWPRLAGSVLGRLFAGFARGYSALHTSLILLSRELDPRITSALLTDWESFAGLPDECSLFVGTESERRAALVAKITSTGGSTSTYFVLMAQALGYSTATVTEFPVSRFGRARFGARFHGRAWRNVWQLNGVSSSQDATLQCRISKLKPAHTTVFFHYGT